MKKVNLLFLVLLLSYTIKAQQCCNITYQWSVGGEDPQPNTGFGLALGDIDGDGDADMAVHSAYEYTYIYRYNNGTYQLSQTLTYSNDDSWQYGLNLIDIDNDGDRDLVTTPMWSSAKMFVYKNNGSGTFSVWQQVSVGTSAYNKDMGDIDNDGDVDIVLASTNSIYVYKNNGNGVFTLFNTFSGEGGRTVHLSDVDNDSDLDALVATQYYGTGVRLYRNTGNGTFTMDNQVIGSSNFHYSSVITGDFNNDGKTDIATGTTWQELEIYKNLGNGYFTHVNTLKWMQGYQSYYMQLRVTDIDMDGRKDIVAGCYSGGISVWTNKNNDFEFTPCYRSALSGYNHGMDVGDINNDGKIDIVGSEANEAIAEVFFNNGGLFGQPASASNSGPVCSGNSLQLYAQPSNANYAWSGPNNFYSSSQNPIISQTNNQSSGNYTVLVSNTHCYNQAVTNVQIYPSPQVNAGNDQTIATGNSAQLNATVSGGSGNYTIQWHPANLLTNSNSLNTSTLPLTNSVLFILTVTDNAYNCSSSDSVLVTVTGSTLSASIQASSTSICQGNTVTLTALGSGGSGNYTYIWASNPQGFSSTQSSVIVQPLTNTIYYVTINDGTTSAYDSIYIIINTPQNFSVWNDGPFCPYETITLYASDAVSYIWSGPNNFTSTLQNPIIGTLPTGQYLYNVTITDSNNCTSQYSTTVQVLPQPSAIGVFSPDSLDISQSTIVNLYGINTGNITSWTWILPDTSIISQNTTYTFNSTGNYNITLIVENVSGCSDTAQYTYVVYNSTYISSNSTNNHIYVYPNPATNYINIMTDEKIIKVEIISLDGKIISSFNQPNKNTFEINNINKGMYLLKLQTTTSQSIIKFTIN